MSEQLKHIFDKTACLSRRQLKDYVNGLMTREETYAAEHHINSCFFCSDAVEGMTDQQTALAAVEELNHGFLKDHFSLINPQVHLNSMAPSASAAPVAVSRRHRARGKAQPAVRTGSLVAFLLLGLGLWWYLQFEKNHMALAMPHGSSGTTKPVTSSERSNGGPTGRSDIQNTQTVAVTTASSSSRDPEAPKESPQKLQPLIMADQKAIAPGKATPEGSAAPKPAIKPKQTPAEKEQAKAGSTNDALKAATAVDAPIQKSQGSGSTVTAPSTPQQTEPEAQPVSSAKLSPSANAGDDPEETAQELYFAGNWSKALIAYRKEMKSDNTRHRQQATIMAARCHLNLGQKGPAIQLLKGLIDEGGPQRKAAKKMLHEVAPDEAE